VPAELTATAAAAATCVLAAVCGFALLTAPQQVAGLVDETQIGRQSSRTPLLAKLFVVIGRRFSPPTRAVMGAKGLATARRRIDSAGRPGGLSIDTYIDRKATYLVLGTIVGVLFTLRMHIGVGAAVFLASWFWLDGWLITLVRQRQQQIERQLPDFLDVLAVTVHAGLGFRAALSRVSGAVGGPMGEEVQTALHRMDLGVTRRQAFQELRERNSSPALGEFVTALLQAEELGAPLSSTLLELAADMRRTAAQAARRRAARAAPRVSLTVTLLIVPGAIILMIAALFLSSTQGATGVFAG
jgi:tight adherence protein C